MVKEKERVEQAMKVYYAQKEYIEKDIPLKLKIILSIFEGMV